MKIQIHKGARLVSHCNVHPVLPRALFTTANNLIVPWSENSAPYCEPYHDHRRAEGNYSSQTNRPILLFFLPQYPVARQEISRETPDLPPDRRVQKAGYIDPHKGLP